MFRRMLVLGVAVTVLCVAAAAASTPSPLGMWKGQNQRIYKWIPYQGNGFEEHAMTSHRTSSNKCLVHVNEAVYRYVPVAGGHYRVTAKIWHKSCNWDWEYESTINLTVAGNRMTESCDKQWTKVCWRYTRVNADTQAPTVQALQSTGKAGGDASLHYTVKDDSGKTHEELTLYVSSSDVRHYKTSLGPALSGHVYGYKLMGIPSDMTGTFKWCLRSFDAAGNASPQSCSTLTIN